MKLLRAASTGFAAVAITWVAGLTPLFAVMLKYRATLRPPLGDGYFAVIHWHTRSAVCVSLLVFAAGFIWQHHRTQ
jgi:hypothetical protein